jgi:replication factor A1
MAEIDNIVVRLKQAGVELNDTEKKELKSKYLQLVKEYHVPPIEAERTIVNMSLKAHNIDTKVWKTGGSAAPVTVSQIKSDNEWVSLKAKIVQVWENNNEKVSWAGLIGDPTGVIKLIIFKRNEDIIPANFCEGESFIFENLVTSVWQGQYSLKANKTTKISSCEPIDAHRRTETIVGLLVSVQKGSGLIRRCPECNRALVKGSCGEHGKVKGQYDLRIKGLFSPFGGNELIELIIPAAPTTELTGMTIDKGKELSVESLDPDTVGDQFRRELAGRYYQVTGNMLQKGSMLVEKIEPVTISTPEKIAEVLEEVRS